MIETSHGFFDPQDEYSLKTVNNYVFNPQDGQVDRVGNTGAEDLTVMLQRYSPNGNYKVFIKASKYGFIIELFNQQVLIHRQVVPFTFHQAVIRKSPAFVTDGICWSQDENRFMYMADDPKANLNIFKLKELGVLRYKYEDIPGERIQGHTNPSIFIFDIPSKTLFKVQKEPETPTSRTIYAMPQFADPQGNSIVCVQMDMVGVFEMAFFTNYPKKLMYLNGLETSNITEGMLKSKVVIPKPVDLTRPGLVENIVYYPKVSPDFTTCAYLYAEDLYNSSSKSSD